MTILRPYQQQANVAAWETISPDVNRVAIEMATGLGKTITFGALIDDWLKDQGGGHLGALLRALVLVHTDELVWQAVAKILFMTGGHLDMKTKVMTFGRWTVGVVKAGRNDVHADIIVASVQTLASPGRRDQIQDVGLIVVDECHHAVTTTYQAILVHFGSLANRYYADAPPRFMVPTFGFTATLARSDGQGLGRIWQDLAFSRSLPWAIRKGHLVDLIPYTIKIPGVEAGASDAVLDGQLADSIAPEAVVDAWLDKTARVDVDVDNVAMYHPRPSTVLFAPLVRSAQAFADAFNTAGVKAEVVHGGLPDAERRAVLERYEAGVTTVVCNAMILTEGWDSPRTKCVIIARPTQSVPLFVQMLGRGLRPWLDAEAPPRDTQRCLLLAVAGATNELVTVADLSDKIDEAVDGKSFLAMEDEWDIGKDIEPDEDNAYHGPVRVEQWDRLVQLSSKAWKYTAGGVPFLPFRKRGGYVFIVDNMVWARTPAPGHGPAVINRLATAPDMELAMATAEDEAQELGGDIGALLADKTRAWRRAVPSVEMLAQARRAGVDESAIARVLSSRASGKAGRLSDLIDTVTASRTLDPNATKIRERVSK